MDDKTFTALLEKARPAMTDLSVRLARNWGVPHMAEDFFQDAAIRAYQKIQQLEDTKKFQAWFSRILRNVVKRHFVAGNNQPRYELTAIFEQTLALNEDFDESIDLDMMNGIIASLPQGYRDVMTLTIHGFSGVEIAEMLGVGESTVRSQRTKARDLIEKKFEAMRATPDGAATPYDGPWESAFLFGETLPPQTRKIFLLSEKGMPPAKIAKHLGNDFDSYYVYHRLAVIQRKREAWQAQQKALSPALEM